MLVTFKHPQIHILVNKILDICSMKQDICPTAGTPVMFYSLSMVNIPTTTVEISSGYIATELHYHNLGSHDITFHSGA